MTATELVGMWKREAQKVLGMRSSGDLEIEVFKVVAQREVSCGWCCSVVLLLATIIAQLSSC